jgi:hypothetical protein
VRDGFISGNFQGAVDCASGIYDLFCHAKILACRFPVQQEPPARNFSLERTNAFIILSEVNVMRRDVAEHDPQIIGMGESGIDQ